MSAPLVFLDTETTALHAGRRAWEVAMIRVEPHLPEDTPGMRRGVSFFVGDVDLTGADPMSLRVGGFYDRHPLYLGGRSPSPERSWVQRDPLDPSRPGPRVLTESQAARVVAEWTHGAHLVGAVPSFDAEVLDRMLRHHRLVPAWHYHLIDVEALMVGYLHGRYGTFLPRVVVGVDPAEVTPAFLEETLAGRRVMTTTYADAEPTSVVVGEPSGFTVDLPWSSDDLSRAVGVEPAPESERHTAMGDARWAQRVYDMVTTGRVRS